MSCLFHCFHPEPRHCFPARRFDVKDIPDDEQECASWLHKLYQEKVNTGLNPNKSDYCSAMQTDFNWWSFFFTRLFF